MITRSGKKLFSGFFRKIRLLPPKAGPPIQTSSSVDQLVQIASDLQDKRFMETEADDAEGVELSSRPPSPLTEYDYESSVAEEDPDAIWEAPQPPSAKRARQNEPSIADAPESSSGPKRLRNDEGDGSPAPSTSYKERRKASAKERRSKKRASHAQSEHPVSSYAAKPSVVERLPTLPALAAKVDAGELPKSLEGSWIGKRVILERDTAWTLEELLQAGFRVIEWDGWWDTPQLPIDTY